MADLTILAARVANIVAGVTPSPPNGDSFVFKSTFDNLLQKLKPTRGQFIKALEASGAGRVATCASLVPTDPSDRDNIAWNHSGVVRATSPLALFVKKSVDLTDAEVSILINQAVDIQE